MSIHTVGGSLCYTLPLAFCYPSLRGANVSVASSSTSGDLLVLASWSHQPEKLVICKRGVKTLEELPRPSSGKFGLGSISKDGQYIAFTYYSNNVSLSGSIWVLERSSGTLTKISSHNQPYTWDSYPRWSEDNKRLVYINADRSSGKLLTAAILVAFDGRTAKQICYLQNVISADVSYDPDFLIYAWSSNGLVALRTDRTVVTLLANDWRGDSILYPNTLVSLSDKKHVAFSTLDPKSGSSMIYELSLSTGSVSKTAVISRKKILSLYERDAVGEIIP